MGHFLKANACVDAQDINNETPLHAACRRHYSIKTIALLLKARASMQNSEDQTPLHIASRAGRATNVLFLLKANASDQAKDCK